MMIDETPDLSFSLLLKAFPSNRSPKQKFNFLHSGVSQKNKLLIRLGYGRWPLSLSCQADRIKNIYLRLHLGKPSSAKSDVFLHIV